jgi:hypothetical protein
MIESGFFASTTDSPYFGADEVGVARNVHGT